MSGSKGTHVVEVEFHPQIFLKRITDFYFPWPVIYRKVNNIN